jgi:uncharacterized membrane protein HdeD (DUF308 family)
VAASLYRETCTIDLILQEEVIAMQKQNQIRFISSLIYIALGLVLIVYPEAVGESICTVLGGAAIIMGILNVIGYAMTTVETRVTQNTNGLTTGIVLALLGIFIIVKSDLVISLIPFILGFMITVKGVSGIQNAVNLKRLGYESLKGGMISSIVIMVFGIVMMMNPFSTAKLLFIMIGIGLLASGIADMIANLMISRMLKKGKAE